MKKGEGGQGRKGRQIRALSGRVPVRLQPDSRGRRLEGAPAQS